MNIEIIDNKVDNFLLSQKIKQIVKEKAKYQKVMLLTDCSTPNSLANLILSEIKDVCVYNILNINADLSEIYNGYKMLIVICSTNSFLQSNIRISEFFCVYLPTDEYIFPYFLNENNSLNKADHTLFLKTSSLDTSVYTSLLFNRFYNFLFDLIYAQTSEIEFIFDIGNITQKNILKMLENLPQDRRLIDIDVIKKFNIDFQDLCLVDYLLISAFNIVINAIKFKAYELVDVYKSAHENYTLIDKFYAMTNNQLFINLITLNFNKLNSACDKTKQSIFEFLKYSKISNKHVSEIIEKIKNYCKTSDNILSYLYLYNVFGV